MFVGILYDLWNQNHIIIGNNGDTKYFTRITLEACNNSTRKYFIISYVNSGKSPENTFEHDIIKEERKKEVFILLLR